MKGRVNNKETRIFTGMIFLFDRFFFLLIITFLATCTLSSICLISGIHDLTNTRSQSVWWKIEAKICCFETSIVNKTEQNTFFFILVVGIKNRLRGRGTYLLTGVWSLWTKRFLGI